MGWVFDLDGVIWRGERPIEGSAAAVREVMARGDDVFFVTNLSQLTVADVEAKLSRHGIDATGRVVTSAMAAATLVRPGERVVACGGPGVVEALDAAGAHVVEHGPADAVVVGYHPEFDYRRMTIAAQAVLAGARLIGTNDDPTYPTPDGLVPGNGALLASVAIAAGVTPAIAGKPYPAMVDVVRARLGVAGIMVGDRADTDGAFAHRLGYRFALVLSGVTGAEDLPVEPRPDWVAADVAQVVRLVGG